MSLLQVMACKRLWLKVLRQAVDDVQRLNTYGSGPYRDFSHNARAWFESEDDGVGSFRWVCVVFNLCPENIRDMINEFLQLTSTSRSALGARFLEYRKRNKLSRRQLAREISVPCYIIRNLELNKFRRSKYFAQIMNFIVEKQI